MSDDQPMDAPAPTEPSPDLLGRLRGRAESGADKRQSRVAELEAQIAELKAEMKRLRQASSSLAALEIEHSKGHWCEVVRQIDRAKELGAILDQFAPGTWNEVNALRQQAAVEAEESISGLSSALPEALEARNHPVEPGSRFPSFRIRNGFFEIKIVRAKFEAQIIVRHGATIKVAADLDVAVDAVVAEINRCFGTPADPQGFVAGLRDAYNTALGTDNPRALPLEEVRGQFAEPRPPRDEFAVSLAAVLRDNPSGAEGMALDHTKSIDTGFLLPGFEDRGYFGHITFNAL